MMPFSKTPPNEYKPENFFPCITKEYKDYVKKSFQLSDPNNIDLDEEDMDLDLNYDVWPPPKDPFDEERPEYVRNTLAFKNIKKGESLNVKRLLCHCKFKGFIRCVPNTSDRDDKKSKFSLAKVRFEEAFKEKKYVMFFCVFAPSKWCEENATYLCRLSHLSSELLRRGHNDFEMVMVAKMRKNENQAYDDKEAFHTLFSAFPGRLAIPYSNEKARDYVCAKLNFNGKVNVVLVGPAPKYEILQCCSSFLLSYGASAFPFTDHALETISQQPSPRFSLPNILSCDPSLRLSTFGSHQTKSESVENLSKKLVGLYLFQSGNLLREFYDVYNQCKQEGSPFEIVLFFMLCSSASVHPDVFLELIHELLGSLSIDISSWWVFPYDSSACLRIEAMFIDEFAEDIDQMIIVGPRGNFVDARGGEVITQFGIYAYPFDREHLVQKYLNRVKEVTLESLLCHRTKDYVVRDCQKYDIEYLKGRNVFLYMDKAPLCLYTFSILCTWYHNIRECDPNFELVFVCCESEKQFLPHACSLPWLICEYEPDHVARLHNHTAFIAGVESRSFIEGLRPPSLIAFGEDGHIQVLDPIYLERMHGHKVNPFRHEFINLRRDVIRRMSDLYFMRDYEHEVINWA